MSRQASIRTATAQDFGFIRAISGRPENLRFIGDADEAELAEYLAAPDKELLIWTRNNTPAGFALFCEIGDPSGRIELRRLALDQAGAGLGSEFVGALVDYGFAQIGAARIWLDVVADNRRAQAVYRKVGFTYEGTLRQNWRCPTGEVLDMQIYGFLRSERE